MGASSAADGPYELVLHNHLLSGLTEEAGDSQWVWIFTVVPCSVGREVPSASVVGANVIWRVLGQFCFTNAFSVSIIN